MAEIPQIRRHPENRGSDRNRGSRPCFVVLLVLVVFIHSVRLMKCSSVSHRQDAVAWIFVFFRASYLIAVK
uniref:Uncharacterized protein n=1 Tax=Triticum urartu TaxID=4572 RepID=A0A8R7TB73_TRIUA